MLNANWITPAENMGDVCPVFRKSWKLEEDAGKIVLATLRITALGVYEAKLNGKRIGEFVLAPGWTAYDSRLQTQEYDVAALLKDAVPAESQDHAQSKKYVLSAESAQPEKNVLPEKGAQSEKPALPGMMVLTATVGKGWMRSPMPGWFESEEKEARKNRPCGLIAELRVRYEDGSEQLIATDDTWEYAAGPVLFSEIYDGETYDARREETVWNPVYLLDWPKEILIPQEGEEIREMERIAAKSVFRTPKGETVVDFGQEVTGYVEFTVNANAGDRICIQHGEVLDSEGNFYNANYRTAKSEIHYICRDGVQTWHPTLTFFGFRYLKLEEFPGLKNVEPEQFTAICVYSQIRRTGELTSSDGQLNQLISNIFWSQKDNFLDVPTDCPQRDERLGWTGDAQVFVKAASYNYDVEKFFTKWLHDMTADQRPDGAVGQVIPDYMPQELTSAAWGDAAVICPWQIYMTYGNPQILRDQFDCMKKWVDYIRNTTTNPNLWLGGTHFGDWLGLDAPSGSYKGSSREDLIASAFYANSVNLLVKAGHVTGKDVSEYEKMYPEIVRAFREAFPDFRTQTEHVIALQFHLAEDPQKTADALARMIWKDGCMKTGFVGTPYLLHVLSDYGYGELAYTLLLRKEYPSWLYSVGKGATTIWEHWDSIMEDGNFWSTDMNSFNHYAYGSVADWLYEKAAGIQPLEDAPGFKKVRIAPQPDARLGRFGASIETRHGRVSSRWTHVHGAVKYEITTPVEAEIVIDGKTENVMPGSYTFWG